MGQGDLDGSDGGAYRPLPVSIWGSLLASKVGFPHSDAQAEAPLSQRSRTVTDGRPRIDMNKSGRFFPHPSLPYPALSIADATQPLRLETCDLTRHPVKHSLPARC